MHNNNNTLKVNMQVNSFFCNGASYPIQVRNDKM